MIDIPALHDAASDRPLRFAPMCSDTAIPICLNPAYAGYLSVTADALAPLLNQLAGLPDAPTRIVQQALIYHQDNGNGISVRQSGPRTAGTPRESHLVLPIQLQGSMTARQSADQLVAAYGPNLVAGVIGDGPRSSPAQNAVARALLKAAGLSEVPDQAPLRSPGRPGGPNGGAGLDPTPWPSVTPGTPTYAASERFAALPAPARHTWLFQHLAALRAGQITLAQLP